MQNKINQDLNKPDSSLRLKPLFRRISCLNSPEEGLKHPPPQRIMRQLTPSLPTCQYEPLRQKKGFEELSNEYKRLRKLKKRGSVELKKGEIEGNNQMRNNGKEQREQREKFSFVQNCGQQQFLLQTPQNNSYQKYRRNSSNPIYRKHLLHTEQSFSINDQSKSQHLQTEGQMDRSSNSYILKKVENEGNEGGNKQMQTDDKDFQVRQMWMFNSNLNFPQYPVDCTQFPVNPLSSMQLINPVQQQSVNKSRILLNSGNKATRFQSIGTRTNKMSKLEQQIILNKANDLNSFVNKIFRKCRDRHC